MRFPIDVAFLDRDRRVVKTMTMKPNRVCPPLREADTVVEARHGAFERWGLRVGDIIEIRSPESHDPHQDLSR